MVRWLVQAIPILGLVAVLGASLAWRSVEVGDGSGAASIGRGVSRSRATDGPVSAPLPPPPCPVTIPNGVTPPGGAPSPGDYGNDALWTYLWPDGRVVFAPGGPGSIEPDGALGMKWPWYRFVPGRLTIEGRRLDESAPPLRADIPDGYGELGFQATGLIFPGEGCCEVTGRVGGASLMFVTLVVEVD